MGSEDNSIDSSDSSVQAVTKLFAKQNIHEVPPDIVQRIPANERMEALQDIHGALEPVEETPAFISEKLNELGLELRRGSINSSICADERELRSAYEEAVLQAPDHVESQLLKFLRADSFDAKKASMRCLKYYQAKLKFFGPGSLGKDVSWRDLDDVDRLALSNGAVQLLQKRDQRGRAIIFFYSPVAVRYPIDVVIKLIFWSAEIASIDEDLQKRGVVFIHYMVNMQDPKRDGTKRGAFIARIISALKTRVVATHACTDDPEFVQTYEQVIPFIDFTIFRFQTHVGSHIECRYNLMSFGIPLDALPVRNDGTLDLTLHLHWLAALERDETRITPVGLVNAGESNFVEPPGPNDIVMGRGQRGAKLPGNAMLRRLVDEYADRYREGERGEKSAISKKVYEVMRKAGSRFLQLAEPVSGPSNSSTITKVPRRRIKSFANEHWIEVDETAACDRISHLFRNVLSNRGKKS